MQTVTVHVLEGFDKGISHRNLRAPLSIGREEGNAVRLNDDRVSRFHAKIVQDGKDMVLADLDSTNGTRVNGQPVQIRRLLAGDRIQLGRSILLYGAAKDIEERMGQVVGGIGSGTIINPDVDPRPFQGGQASPGYKTEKHLTAPWGEITLNGNPWDKFGQEPISARSGAVFQGPWELPPLPDEMSPSQAARLVEILDFLHWHLSLTAEVAKLSETAEVHLRADAWLRLQAVQMAMARYIRVASEPSSGEKLEK